MSKLPKDLSKDEKLNYALQLIEQGYNRKYISESMGYSRPDSLDRFITKHGFIVDKDNNRYIRQLEDGCPINEIAVTMEDSCPIDVVQEDSCPTIGVQNQQKLMDIIDNHNKIMDMIKWFDTMEDTCPILIKWEVVP